MPSSSPITGPNFSPPVGERTDFAAGGPAAPSADDDFHQCAADFPATRDLGCVASLLALVGQTPGDDLPDSKADQEFVRGRSLALQLAQARLYDKDLTILPWSVTDCADVLFWVKNLQPVSPAGSLCSRNSGDMTPGLVWLLDNVEGSLRALAAGRRS